MTTEETIQQRIIGAEIMTRRIRRALMLHDVRRKRPETTTAQEIIKQEYATFQLQREQEGLPPAVSEVKECAWLSSAAAIGFFVGIVFTKIIS